jgi:hypothetical protein
LKSTTYGLKVEVCVSKQHLVVVEEDAETEDEDKQNAKLLNVYGKESAPGSGNKVPQKNIKLAADCRGGRRGEGGWEREGEVERRRF